MVIRNLVSFSLLYPWESVKSVAVFFLNIYPQGAVVNSPPTVDPAVERGKLKSFRFLSLLVRGGLGNGSRVTGRYLADHLGQHILLCRQDLVAAGWSFSSHGLYRRTIHPNVDSDGNYFSGGATLSGLLRLEIPGAALRAAGGLFAWQCEA